MKIIREDGALQFSSWKEILREASDKKIRCPGVSHAQFLIAF